MKQIHARPSLRRFGQRGATITRLARTLARALARALTLVGALLLSAPLLAQMSSVPL
ncbi:MAG: hypothetical protein H3C27_18200, partial [Opitutaceae bacterium]|nr:hypothetical protein [Opitutaceae bacterium]